MKKKFQTFLIFSLVFLFGLVSKIQTYAQNFNTAIPNPTIFNSLEDLVNFGAGLIRPVFILTFIGVILYAAFVWLTSQGDDKKIEQARKIIVAAIVGLSLAVFAPAITSIVSSFLGVQTLDIFGN